MVVLHFFLVDSPLIYILFSLCLIFQIFRYKDLKIRICEKYSVVEKDIITIIVVRLIEGGLPVWRGI